MQPLSFRCPDNGQRVTSGLLVDPASLLLLRERTIVVRCPCGGEHRLGFGDLFECSIPDEMPPFDPPRLRRGSISG